MKQLPAAGHLVKVEAGKQVIGVTISRPARHNSLVPRLLAELARAFRQVNESATARVAVLAAEGPSFSTGGDLEGFLDHREDIEAYASNIVSALNDCIDSMLQCRVPIIAAVDGQVSGGALGLVLASDIVLVTENASFTPYYSEVGFSPDGGWTAMLPDFIGRGRAGAIQYLNDTISAEQAVQWGLAYAMIGARDLESEIDALCRRICAKRGGSLVSTKSLLSTGRWRECLEREREAFVATIKGGEALRGIENFLSQHRKRR